MREKLINICTPRQWKTLSTSELKDEGYTVYGANGVIGYYSEYNHETETVMVTCRGATCGTVNISKPYSYINGNAMCMDDLRHDIDVKYLYYALKNYDFKEVISGSAQPQITRQGLNNVFVEVVDKPRQLEIVKVLSNVEETISRKQQQLTEYDQLIKSRFIEMFADYKKVELSTLASITMGQSPNSKSYNDNGEGLPFFQGKADFGDKYTIVNHWTTSPTKIANKNDVLMSVRAPVGPVNISSVDCCIGRGLCAINTIKSKTNNEFLYNALNAMQYELSHMGSGSTFKAINKSDVYGLLIPEAPIDMQNQFAYFVQQIDKLKFEVQKSLEATQMFFDSLMQEYFG